MNEYISISTETKAKGEAVPVWTRKLCLRILALPAGKVTASFVGERTSGKVKYIYESLGQRCQNIDHMFEKNQNKR